MEKQQVFRALLTILVIGVLVLGLYLFTGAKKSTDNLIEGLAPVSSVEVLILESFPVQVRVVVSGGFSNGCWEMGDYAVGRNGNVFEVTLSAFGPAPDMICTQVAPMFEEVIPLDVYGLPAGTYIVSANGVTSEFTLSIDNSVSEEVVTEEGEVFFDVEGEIIAGGMSPFVDFNQADYETLLESDKTIMLYFYAKWCPTCKRELRDATEPAFLNYYGKDVIGFRVNYNDSDTDDFEEALANEFGVLYQHTKVFIKNKEVVGVYPNSWSEEEYLSKFNELSI
jgi:inhibitor of cysteine peptidase